MNTAPYNDYVLSSCLEAGWITEEQYQLVLQALERMPGMAALDFLVEQQILAPANANVLVGLINEAETANRAQHQAPAPQAAHAPAGHAAPAPQPKVVVEPPSKFESVRDYLQYAVSTGASDVHLGPEAPPLIRIGGQLAPIYEGVPRFTKEESEKLARGFLTEAQAKHVEEIGSLDFCYEVEGLGRFRASCVRQRRGWESVFRVISTHIRSMQELGLPEVVYSLLKYHNGLILVTGTVGCGKSTTLAAMVNQVNHERKEHIITLEDPIEYVFAPAGCQVTQREIHSHTESFGAALRASLREDPDVIMVGEMRDLETISLAITASETGHLVLGTLHTSTAARTLDRLLDVFPIEQQSQIRTMVSESIRGIICQQLVPRADGKGRALAMEIMVNNPAVGNLIREAKTFMLPGVMQVGKRLGMKLMDDSLMELLEAGTITQEEAYLRSENKKVFAAAMAGHR